MAAPKKKGTYLGFDKLKAEVAKEGNVDDPAAVAAAIGRKKYGKAGMAKKAAAGAKAASSTSKHMRAVRVKSNRSNGK